MIYVPIDGHNYAIATLDSDMKEVPLSFVAKTMGEYTISMEMDKEVFEEVYLVDNITGDETDMLTKEYTFIAKANDIPDRFAIRFRKENSLEEQLDGNDRFAYFDNGRLIVDNVSGDVVIDIYDVMGRKVASSLTKNTDTSCCVEFEGNKTGLYIIRLSDKKGIRTQKIIL
jgi:hypothetical protein